MSELRDLYDINSNKTDKTYIKGEEIPKGYYPMVVMVVIRNSKGEFLMQKRSLNKGGDWGVTGGHPKSGETPIEGIITEVKEELGLDFSNEEFIEYDSGCDGKDCYKMYLVNKDINIKDVKIQQEELSEVRWFSMDELRHMVDIKELNENQISCFIKVCKFLIDNPKTTNEVNEKIKEHIEIEKEIIMVTGNSGKYKIAKDIFIEKGLNLIQEKIETPEIQSYNVEDVSAYSALYAAKELNKPVIKSDVGYFIPALNGFPGPFVKYINGMLSSEGILKLMENKTDRTIFLKECLTYATPTGEIKQFINEEKASIALSAYGTGSAFDRIVIFEGQEMPKSMNSDEENLEHFKKSLKVYEDVAEYLKNLI
ncbi:MAG: NUDIX domain-containing protein [Bacilli bacterium]|nr:NUDIX domain-containing protein [Bacilli bacterium]